MQWKTPDFARWSKRNDAVLVTLLVTFGRFGTCPQNLLSVSELREDWHTVILTVHHFPSVISTFPLRFV
jgi:hypothetical protein